MGFFDSSFLIWALPVSAAIGIIQLVTCCIMLMAQRSLKQEAAALNKETFGLLRRFEGLTASKREKILKEYDRMLEELSNRLPTTIAAQASQRIFETESRILNRLAELEPILKEDKLSQNRMDELIRSMEQLEETLVGSTAETVKKVFLETRSSLFNEEDQLGPPPSRIAWSQPREIL
jgi:hypothetical protein